MTLQSIDIPDSIKRIPHSSAATRLIDLANDRIEAFLLAEDSANENFIPCDFHLLDQSLTWMEQNQLLTGRRFCELGSGFGVAALLASLRGMESVGIEIDPALVEQAKKLASDLDLPAKFYCGSFVPRGKFGTLETGPEWERDSNDRIDEYEATGLGLSDFDLLFVFPWPNEQQLMETLFQEAAANHTLLLSYHGRNGMQLIRKT